MAGLGCCPKGVLVLELPDASEETIVRLRWSELANPGAPGSTYAAVRLIGGTDEVDVELRLPGVTSDDDAYAIEVENRSAGAVLISSDGGGASFTLDEALESEASLEQEIQDAAESTWTYRTSVRVTTDGARRVPGFSGP